MEAEGNRSKTSSNVASPVVIVRKKNGALKAYVDYRKLNSLVLSDCFPVPFMGEVGRNYR